MLWAEHRDLDARRVRRQMRRDNGRGGRHATVRIMVFCDANPIETELFDQPQPLDHAPISVGAGTAVIFGRRQRPAAGQRSWRPVVSGFEI